VYIKTNLSHTVEEIHINTKNDVSEQVHTDSDDENDSKNRNNISDDQRR